MLRLPGGFAHTGVAVLFGAADEICRLRVGELRGSFHDAAADGGILLLAVRRLENFEQLRLDVASMANRLRILLLISGWKDQPASTLRRWPKWQR